MPELDGRGLSVMLQQKLLSLASKPNGSPALSPDRSIRSDIGLEEIETMDSLGWGYNFPWQGRAFYQPAWFPTVVCSSFVLDSFGASDSPFYPALCRKLASFTLGTLNVHEDDSGICFSYSPRDSSRVFNASLFAAKILARAVRHDPKNGDVYRTMALRACDYVTARQRGDGSWVYGEARHWQWVDNLHTGFVIETLNYISETLGTKDYDRVLQNGMEFYSNSLFEKDMTPRYYSDSRYPLDPHSYAQGAITFIELDRFTEDGHSIAGKILERAMEDLWDNKQKGFVFRRYPGHTKKTIYLRWSQGWMFKAISHFLSGDR
jgi:hypothetical protein